MMSTVNIPDEFLALDDDELLECIEIIERWADDENGD